MPNHNPDSQLRPHTSMSLPGYYPHTFLQGELGPTEESLSGSAGFEDLS